MSSLKCPFPSASNFLLPHNYPQLCLSSSWGIDAGGARGEQPCRSSQVSTNSVILSISLRFNGSPYIPKLLPAPRHIFRRGIRTARMNLNLILTSMFLAERYRKVFLELSPHSNLWAWNNLQIFHCRLSQERQIKFVCTPNSARASRHIQAKTGARTTITRATWEHTSLFGERRAWLMFGRYLWASVGRVFVNQCE